MNRDILNDYREKDDKILLAQILDKIEMVEKKNKIEYTDFLDLAQTFFFLLVQIHHKQYNFLF